MAPMDARDLVVVTGAAGGIGRATAALLLARGFAVLGVDLAPAVTDLAGSEGYEALVADITSASDLARLRAAVAGRPRAAHLVLAAGGALGEEIDETDPIGPPVAVFRRSVELNLVAQFDTIRHVVPALAARPPGKRSVTLVSSINAVGDFGYPAYSAAKAGLAGLMAALTAPLGRLGVRINTVAFGTVLTDRSHQLHGGDAGHYSALTGLSTLGRLMSAEDAAEVLATVVERLETVTGTVITADCGQSVPGFHARD